MSAKKVIDLIDQLPDDSICANVIIQYDNGEVVEYQNVSYSGCGDWLISFRIKPITDSANGYMYLTYRGVKQFIVNYIDNPKKKE